MAGISGVLLSGWSTIVYEVLREAMHIHDQSCVP
jgi:hypothetical protein